MGRHLKRSRPTVAPGVVLGPLLVVGVSALVAGLALTTRDGSPATVAQSCPTALPVGTAASFAPVLAGVAPTLAEGADCVRLDVTVADGRTAAGGGGGGGAGGRGAGWARRCGPRTTRDGREPPARPGSRRRPSPGRGGCSPRARSTWSPTRPRP